MLIGLAELPAVPFDALPVISLLGIPALSPKTVDQPLRPRLALVSGG